MPEVATPKPASKLSWVRFDSPRRAKDVLRLHFIDTHCVLPPLDPNAYSKPKKREEAILPPPKMPMTALIHNFTADVNTVGNEVIVQCGCE